VIEELPKKKTTLRKCRQTKEIEPCSLETQTIRKGDRALSFGDIDRLRDRALLPLGDTNRVLPENHLDACWTVNSI